VQFEKAFNLRLVLFTLAVTLSGLLWCGCRSGPPASPPRDLFVSYSGEPEDWDHDGSPDGIIVKVTPLGAQGQPLRLFGELCFHLYEASDTDIRAASRAALPLTSWKIGATELENHWVAGPFPGYVFRLDWGKLPAEAAVAKLDIVLVPEVGLSCQRTISVRLR